MNNNQKSLGQKIKKFRTQAGFSQLKLETAIGASPGSVSRIESGKVNPSKETLLQISNQLKLRLLDSLSLFDIDTTSINNLLILNNKLATVHNLIDIIKLAANELVKILDILGIAIFLRQGNLIHSITITEAYYTKALFSILPKQFHEYKTTLNNTDNMIVKAILQKKILHTTGYKGITTNVVDHKLIPLLEVVTQVKSGIIIPLIHKNESIGAIYFDKKYKDDFKNELEILKSFTNSVAINIMRTINND